MKKVIPRLIIIGLLLGGISQQAKAQDKGLEFNLNAGALTSFDFDDILFTFGAGLDYHLGEHISISPELQLWTFNFEFKEIYLNPGIILNFRLKNFFIGGGVISPFEGLSPIYPYFLPKINAGFRIKNIKLTLYLIFPNDDFPELFLTGANIGIVF